MHWLEQCHTIYLNRERIEWRISEIDKRNSKLFVFFGAVRFVAFDVIQETYNCVVSKMLKTKLFYVFTTNDFFTGLHFYWNETKSSTLSYFQRIKKKLLLTSTPCHLHRCLIVVAFEKERFGVKKVHLTVWRELFYLLIYGICLFIDF